jgi:hypothetical protein
MNARMALLDVRAPAHKRPAEIMIQIHAMSGEHLNPAGMGAIQQLGNAKIIVISTGVVTGHAIAVKPGKPAIRTVAKLMAKAAQLQIHQRHTAVQGHVHMTASVERLHVLLMPIALQING